MQTVTEGATPLSKHFHSRMENHPNPLGTQLYLPLTLSTFREIPREGSRENGVEIELNSIKKNLTKSGTQ